MHNAATCAQTEWEVESVQRFHVELPTPCNHMLNIARSCSFRASTGMTNRLLGELLRDLVRNWTTRKTLLTDMRVML